MAMTEYQTMEDTEAICAMMFQNLDDEHYGNVEMLLNTPFAKESLRIAGVISAALCASFPLSGSN